MVSALKKKELYTQRLKCKRSKIKLYINEDLTKDDAATFKRARDDSKSGKLHSTWTFNGIVWGKRSEDGKSFKV
jgi:hypothetical protein